MELQLDIKSTLPDSSSEEQYFDITSFFSQAPGNIKFWIGRKHGCQLRIADKKISRRHCYIEKTSDGNLKLVDNGSNNGCLVNGIKITEVVLNEGDNISIGPYDMVIRKKGALADIPRREIAIPHLHQAQKAKATSSTFQLLVAAFIIILGLVFLMILFNQKDKNNDYVDNTQKPTPDIESITKTEPAVISIPQITNPPSITAITPVSKTDNTLKPPTPDDLTRRTMEEFEKQQQALKEQREKEEAERQARMKAEQEKQAELKRQQEEQRKLTEEKPLWSAQKTKIAQLIAKYQYYNALETLNGFLQTVKTESIKAEINCYLDDLKGEYLLFKKMVANASSNTTGSARKKLTIDNRTIYITKADEGKVEGTISGLSDSIYTRQWSDIPQDAVLELFQIDLARTERFCLATFCYNHNLPKDGERILISCLKNNPDEKDRIDRFLARYRDITLPEGGFYEYQGQLITAEEKSYIDKGYIKYQSKWMSYEDMMTAKGLVKYQSKWVTPDEKDKIEARYNKLTNLQGLLSPKGVIDKPGADKEKLPWDKARSKETEHYSIKTNLTQEALNDICYVMECYYCEAKKIFKLSREPSKKLNICVFKEAKEYVDRGGPGSGAYFHGEGIMTFYQPNGENSMMMNTTSVLLHEGTHQFVDLVCDAEKIPIWINEGLATYYESSKFEGTSLKTNLINQGRLQLIRNMIIKKDVPRLEDIINIRQANFALYEYAQTWSLVYFFINYNNGQYADQLENYFAAIKKRGFENRPQHKQMFEDAFKVKFEVLEKQWENYILKLK
jgi:hypothetical protein